MRTDLQGEGSYKYECRKPGCWFCEAMGLKPLPELYVYTEHPIIETAYERRMVHHWEEREIVILRKNYRLHPIDIVPLLPNRTANAIAIKMSVLRAKKRIPVWK